MHLSIQLQDISQNNCFIVAVSPQATSAKKPVIGSCQFKLYVCSFVCASAYMPANQNPDLEKQDKWQREGEVNLQTVSFIPSSPFLSISCLTGLSCLSLAVCLISTIKQCLQKRKRIQERRFVSPQTTQ